MRKKDNWALGLSAVAILVAISSFGITKYELTYDKVNFLITILAILVTTLIGWQIFNVINFENRLSKLRNEAISEFEEKVKIESEKITKLETDFTSKIEKINNKNSEYYTRIYYNLSFILHTSKQYAPSFQCLILAYDNVSLKNKKQLNIVKRRLLNYKIGNLENCTSEGLNQFIEHINTLQEDKKIDEIIAIKGKLINLLNSKNKKVNNTNEL